MASLFVDVRDTLLRHGLKLTAQYGTSGYWIDFAVQHPAQPGRYVLAIECDGATYHRSATARDRDRIKTHARRELHAEMAEPANSQNGNEVARPRPAVP